MELVVKQGWLRYIPNACFGYIWREQIPYSCHGELFILCFCFVFISSCRLKHPKTRAVCTTRHGMKHRCLLFEKEIPQLFLKSRNILWIKYIWRSFKTSLIIVEFPHDITKSNLHFTDFLIKSPFYWHGFTSILACTSNYIHYKVWDEITYPFPIFNDATVEIWVWISNSIPHFLTCN